MKSKKAILGLDTVRLVMLAILGLAIIGVTIFIVLDAIVDSDTSLKTTVFINEVTSVLMNETGYNLAGSLGRANCVGTIVRVINTTGEFIDPANYTISGCFFNITPANIGTVYHNISAWTLNGSYTDNEDAHLIFRNITAGTNNFFGNVPVFFTLLAVVVIILIISIVIIAVNRFGGGTVNQGSPREPNF